MYLHSNMVRFIIDIHKEIRYTCRLIYIPIWLDLLYARTITPNQSNNYLHSNMVRFIIDQSADVYNHRIIFTFQYG